jgi:hypothetical protein
LELTSVSFLIRLQKFSFETGRQYEIRWFTDPDMEKQQQIRALLLFLFPVVFFVLAWLFVIFFTTES